MYHNTSYICKKSIKTKGRSVHRRDGGAVWWREYDETPYAGKYNLITYKTINDEAGKIQ